MSPGDHPDWQPPPALFPSVFGSDNTLHAGVGTTNNVLLSVPAGQRFRLMALHVGMAFAGEGGAAIGTSRATVTVSLGASTIYAFSIPIRHDAAQEFHEVRDSPLLWYLGSGRLGVDGGDLSIALDVATLVGTASAGARLDASIWYVGVQEAV